MLLSVKNVHKSFMVKTGFFKKQRQHVLHDISFTLLEGECLGIIGESGSGKSTLGKLILGLEKPDGGTITFAPHIAKNPLLRSVVFQDYTTSINPRMRMGEAIAEPLQRLNLSKSTLHERVRALLHEVNLTENLIDHYAHQLSGGQLQRVCIARALAAQPSFILFDEALSSLDTAVQAQILMLMRQLQVKYTMTFIFITHDLTVASYLCNKLLFLQQGRVEEYIENLHDLPHSTNAYVTNFLQTAQHLECPIIQKKA